MRNKNNETPDLKRFVRILKGKGMKATPQRLAVHKAMMELGHASAEMIVDNIRTQGEVKVTVPSVYNILSDFAGAKIYARRMSPDKKMFFDVNPFNHIHIYDSKEREFRNVMDDKLIEIVESHLKGRRFRGYKIDAVDIQLVCHSTRKKHPDTL